MTDSDYARKYLALEASATHRGLEFTLTFSQYKKLYETRKCFYTKKKISHKDHTFSLDRVDSSKGYTKGNVVACDKRLNELKSNLTFEQITALYLGILKHQNKTN